MVDLAVVGGGLSGLTAALAAAREGASVALFEAGKLGGRARSQHMDGFTLNMGPHALYRKGEGLAVLNELGVPVRGAVPPSSGLALRAGALSLLPTGPVSIIRTGLLSVSSKIEVTTLLAKLHRIDTSALASVSVSSWLDDAFTGREAREFLEALFRLSTYVNAPGLLSAGTAIERLRLAARGVLYLDGGWQSLVDALAVRAHDAGVLIHQRRAVRAIDKTARGFRVLMDDVSLDAAAVIVAASPRVSASLIGAHATSFARRLSTEPIPVRLACLDVALDRIPRPEARFALGIDDPVYVALHSDVARLAPQGGGLFHVARYLKPGERGESCRPELEAVLETLQPGWRELVRHVRFLPDMVVSHGLPEARLGGVRGRPEAIVPELPGLFLAGDWVGPLGHLADAAIVSGRDAASAALAYTARQALAA